ncbi:PPIC-type PPIASE domain-containing protein [Solimonas aquatica]|uniref:peptidylprolyl isomerase n=1 Tax=Solimonas aquatica TaxID=489703 RepID=A0A1H9JV61_9GAMM|nr:peptidylprolyl isomerase [Solimonas aquatica]SEQ90692.1 PPIC-type PPIASE domain-containing protein [Solimonas aquatica]
MTARVRLGALISRSLREPLLQFLLAGAALLLAQHFIAPALSGTQSPATLIELPAAQLDSLRASYREAYGREPDVQQLRELAQRWVDDEILYREALALGLDRGDPIVRRELQQKMRFLLEDSTPLPEPSEAELAQYLQTHAQRYAQPPRYRFEQVYVSRERSAEGDVAARAARLQARLQTRPENPRGLGDPLPFTAPQNAQTASEIRRQYGSAVAQALETLPPGQWSAPVASGLGLHLLRLIAREPGRDATLDEVRARLRVDCRQAQREAANRKTLEALRQRYRVQLAPIS